MKERKKEGKTRKGMNDRMEEKEKEVNRETEKGNIDERNRRERTPQWKRMKERRKKKTEKNE